MATQTVPARTEVPGGGPATEFDLEVLTEELTVRELLRAWVHQTTKDDYARRVQEREARIDAAPHGRADLRAVRAVDPEQAFEQALRAFEGNGVLVLVGEKQVQTLDERVVVRPGDAVTFLRLVPLVGG